MFFERLGHFVFRHRWAVIFTWLVLIILSAVLAIRVMSVLAPGAYYTTSGEAVDGYRILEQDLGIRPNMLTVVFTSETLRVDDPLYTDEVDQALAGLRDMQSLDPPITYRNTGDPHLISADGHTTYAIIGVDGDIYQACKLLPDVREKMQSQSHLCMFVTGDAAFAYDTEMVCLHGFEEVGKYTFPLVAMVLVLVFGSLVAAGLPLAVGGASVAIAMALIFFVGQFTNMTTTSLIVVTFLGLGVSIDFSLLMVVRFREELRGGKGREESVVTTVATSGKAIFCSAVTAMLGFAALTTFSMSGIRSFGIGGMLILPMALAAGLTLVPALLAVLGPRINRLTLFRLSEREGTFWQRLARWEMRHPGVVMLLVIPFIGLLIWPLGGLHVSGGSTASIPHSAPARSGYEILQEGFGGGELGPILVVVTTRLGEISRWDNVSRLYDFTREIARNKEVSRIESIVNLDPAITREQYQLMYAFPESMPDPRIKDALDRLTSDQATVIRVYGRHYLLSQEVTELVTFIRDLEPGGLETYVTGPAAHMKDTIDQLYSYFRWVVLFIMVACYLALFWLFRSVFLPLKAIMLNAASVAATYGVIVFIFQQGHFSGLLNFTANGTIEAILPIVIFCVVFGLSMDYEVFLLSRVMETWIDTKDNIASVALGLERTGRVITSAALIMVVVFGSLVAVDFVGMKVVGMGVALAILLDATVIRVLLAPALMRVMGKWNWWAPAFMERLWTPRGRTRD